MTVHAKMAIGKARNTTVTLKDLSDKVDLKGL